MIRRNRISFLVILLFVTLTENAQQFSYTAALPVITEPGFYRIPLSSELLSKSKTDQSDLRIIDNEGRQVPFILRKGISSFFGRSYQESTLPAGDRK